ncbi:MAG: TonB-dependent receptor [Myxococcota bacterium]
MGVLFLVMAAATETSTVATPNPVAAEVSAPADWSVEDMDRVVVTGARREELQAEAVVRTEVLTRVEIEQSGGENLAEILEGFPGIRVENNFAGAGIQVRGLDAQHTLILIDGMRLNGRVGGVVDLQRIPAERIERIEVVKGPASALYGSDALGGVINIITKDGTTEPRGHVHLAVGSFGDEAQSIVDGDGPKTLDMSAGFTTSEGPWTGSVNGGFHFQDAFDLQPDDVATTGSQLRSFNFESTNQFRLSPKVRLRLRGDVFRRELSGTEIGAELDEVENNPFRDSDTRAVFGRRNNTTTWSVAAGPRVDLGARRRLDATVSYTQFEDDFIRDQLGEDLNDLNQRTTDRLATMVTQYDGEFGDRHHFTGGVELLYEGLETPRIRQERADRGRFSVYAQHEWEILPRLQLVPGMRAEVDSQFGFFPAPKIALRYNPIDELSLRASYGLGYRAPTVRELNLTFVNVAVGYEVQGNPDLQPELSRGLTIGAEWRILKDLFEGSSFNVEFFRNDVDDLIVFVIPEDAPPPGQRQIFRNENVESALTQGLELLFITAWTRFFSTDFGYTFLDAQDLAQDRELPGRSRHLLTFRGLLMARKIGLSAWVRGYWASRSVFFVSNGDGTESARFIPEVFSLDLRAEQRFYKGVSAFLGADNLANAGNLNNPLLPRTVYAGLNGRF